MRARTATRIFVEPCGENTEEMYLQGASSSLPEDVQNAFYRSIKGFEHIEIMRPAYAIEYDCVDPTSLEATLESKVVRGLYGAGQFNGTSGYEEAAAQGLLAGLNAARNALGKEQLDPAASHQLPWHPGGRSGDQGRHGPLPHDDQPQRIPADPAAGQCRRRA